MKIINVKMMYLLLCFLLINADDNLLEFINNRTFFHSLRGSTEKWNQFKKVHLNSKYDFSYYTNIKGFVSSKSDFVLCDMEVTWENSLSVHEMISKWNEMDQKNAEFIEGEIFNTVLEKNTGIFELRWRSSDLLNSFIMGYCHDKKSNRFQFKIGRFSISDIQIEDKHKFFVPIRYEPSKINLDTMRGLFSVLNDKYYRGNNESISASLNAIKNYRKEINPYLALVLEIICSKNNENIGFILSTEFKKNIRNYNVFNNPTIKSTCHNFITHLIQTEKFFLDNAIVGIFENDIEEKFFNHLKELIKIHILIENEYKDHMHRILYVLWKYSEPQLSKADKDAVFEQLNNELAIFLCFYYNYIQFLSDYLVYASTLIKVKIENDESTEISNNNQNNEQLELCENLKYDNKAACFLLFEETIISGILLIVIALIQNLQIFLKKTARFEKNSQFLIEIVNSKKKIFVSYRFALYSNMLLERIAPEGLVPTTAYIDEKKKKNISTEMKNILTEMKNILNEMENIICSLKTNYKGWVIDRKGQQNTTKTIHSYLLQWSLRINDLNDFNDNIQLSQENTALTNEWLNPSIYIYMGAIIMMMNSTRDSICEMEGMSKNENKKSSYFNKKKEGLKQMKKIRKEILKKLDGSEIYLRQFQEKQMEAIDFLIDMIKKLSFSYTNE